MRRSCGCRLKVGNRNDGLQPLRDLDSVRSFLSGTGPTALFDLPWMPLYLAICFLFHPYIGLAALFGAIILGIITMLTEAMTREPTRAATGFAMTRTSLAEASRRNAEVLTAMGMASRIARALERGQHQVPGEPTARQRRRRRLRIGVQGAAHDAAVGRARRRRLSRDLSAGDRGHHHRRLDPERARAGAGRSGDRQLARLRRAPGRAGSASPICSRCCHRSSRRRWRCSRRHRASWSRTSASCRPAAEESSCRTSALRCRAGNGLGIIGPSGSGKSSLARLLVGVWRPARGRIRLDGAALDQWSPDALGTHIGYLPQDVELFAGTVAQNIAPLFRAAGRRGGDRRGQRRGRARSDRRPAGRIRDPGRRKRHGAVGRAAPARRARARALWRSVPGRAGRAELEPRRRGRRSAEPGHHERAQRAAASSSSSRIARARSPASTCC